MLLLLRGLLAGLGGVLLRVLPCRRCCHLMWTA
jgi:hypothetical protein